MGIIFDLDGTLVDSALDFSAIRREMGLAAGASILEALERMDEANAQRCWKILERHEFQCAERSSLMPGVLDFLDHLDRLDIQRAIVTRNSSAMANAILSRCGLVFDTVLARDDGPAKPDPWAVHYTCNLWGYHPRQVAVVGDFRFDIEAGNTAGTKTVYFTRGRNATQMEGAEQADFSLDSFDKPQALLKFLGIGEEV